MFLAVSNLVNRISLRAYQLAPRVLKPTLALMPMSVHKAVLLPTLRVIFKEALEDGDFEFLTGKVLSVHIRDLGVNWFLSYKNEDLLMTDQSEPDVSFTANGDDLLLIAARKEDPDSLFFKRRLLIEGDTELGLEVKNLIDAIDLEQLPHRVNMGVDYAATWVAQYQK